MKNNLFKNWNLRRIFYAVAGILIGFEAIRSQQWFMLIPGIYFFAMGLFAFGCASGNCYGDNCNIPSKNTSSKN